MVTIIWGATKKPVSSLRLREFFEANEKYDGFLYIGYPVIGTPDGPYPIDAIWLNSNKGLIAFNLVEGKDLSNYEELQDDSANKLEAKLKNHKNLMKGRNLQIPLSIVTFAPIGTIPEHGVDPEYPLCKGEDLGEFLDGLEDSDIAAYNEALSVIQSISTIRKGRKKRELKRADSRGAILKSLEDSIANLDNLQGRAVIETVDGVQRIRGLAGSGKTIVLALKAAYLHAQHPDWKIAVTFNTRSLKGQFKRLINTFFIEQTNEEPDWDNLSIINSWGAPGGTDRNGIYYNFCQAHGLEYLDLTAAKHKFRQNFEFEGVCGKALSEAQSIKPYYDAILIDEAQDFSPEFLKLCYAFLKGEKRLVYAYDELQNLSNRSLPSPEEIFGKKPDGTPNVKFGKQRAGEPQQDIILEKCYRNSRPMLATAHALGFGIYRRPPTGASTGLIQMFDNKELWIDVGYSVTSGSLEENHQVCLSRTEESSPRFLETHSPLDDLIQFHKFESLEDQAAWLSKEIEKNITEDELQHGDIVVINPDPLTTRNAVAPARKILFQRGISSHLAGVDTSPDIFFDSDGNSVAFTGIFRAKGNEAGMVYIINAQDCFSSFGNISRIRNRLFTAITRSKAWVRVLGVGPNMEQLQEEFNQVRAHQFELDFRYPTEEERKQLNIVNREMTTEEKQSVKSGAENLTKLVSDLQQGLVYLEDLPESSVHLLREILERGKK